MSLRLKTYYIINVFLSEHWKQVPQIWTWVKILLVTSEKSVSALCTVSLYLVVVNYWWGGIWGKNSLPQRASTVLYWAWTVQLETSCSPHHAGEIEKISSRLCLMPALMFSRECTYSYAAAVVCVLWRQTGKQAPFITDVGSVGLWRHFKCVRGRTHLNSVKTFERNCRLWAIMGGAGAKHLQTTADTQALFLAVVTLC